MLLWSETDEEANIGESQPMRNLLG